MEKRIMLLLGWLLVIVPLQGQPIDSIYQPLYQLSSEATFVTVDALQQIYIATEAGKLLKLDKNGQLLFEYNNRRLGKVGGIDASNPFSVLVYYPELATVVLLDRTLSEIKSINLFDLNIFEPQAVALSNDNNIWVYDPINFQLKKISKEGRILFQSKPLHQIIQLVLTPTFLIERNNQLILSDTLNGIFIFDGFGQLQMHINEAGVQQFQVINDQLVYTKEGILYSYNQDVSLKKELMTVPHTERMLCLPTQYITIKGKEIGSIPKEGF